MKSWKMNRTDDDDDDDDQTNKQKKNQQKKTVYELINAIYIKLTRSVWK